MPERKPVMEEDRMPADKAIAVDKRSASDTPACKPDAAEAGVGKSAAHSAKAVSTKTMAAKTMPTKAPMATTAAVSPSR